MNCRRFIGLSLLLIAVILAIGGMASQDWYNRTFADESKMTAGLQKYTWTDKNHTWSESGQLSNPSADLQRVGGQRLGDFMHSLSKTGVAVICLGVFAMVLTLIGVALFWNTDNEETRATMGAGCKRFCAYFLQLVAVVMYAMGALLYATAFDFGYSYPLFFLAGFVQIIAFIILTLDVTSMHTWKKQVAGVFLVLVAMLLTCLSMGLNGWYHCDENEVDSKFGLLYHGEKGIVDLGLMRFTFTPNNDTAITVWTTDWASSGLVDPTGDFKNYVEEWTWARNAILATGIIDVVLTFFCLCAFFVRFCRCGQRLSTLAGFGLFGLLLAVAGAGIGIVVYSKQMDVGNGFLVYIAADFVTLTGTIVMANAAYQAARDAQIAVLAGRDEIRAKVAARAGKTSSGAGKSKGGKGKGKGASRV